MLPWMLGGLAVVAFFAWRAIHNAEEEDRRNKEARRNKARAEH
jgi:hypothetical protein